MKRAQRIGRLFPLVGLLCAALRVPALCSTDDLVTMNLEDMGHGTYRLEGHFNIKGSPYDVWKVLTDYENISNFVSSLRKSTVKDSTTDRIVLEQEAMGKEFVFTHRVHVLLQVTEIPYKRIDFEDIAHKDFAFYDGSWSIHSSVEGLDVVYRLYCKRLFIVPNVIAKDALKKNATSLLSQVLAEVLRRQGGGSKRICCSQ